MIMATNTTSKLLAATCLWLALCSCQNTADHHHHTATPHHGKNMPSDCTATREMKN